MSLLLNLPSEMSTELTFKKSHPNSDAALYERIAALMSPLLRVKVWGLGLGFRSVGLGLVLCSADVAPAWGLGVLV